MTPTATPAVLIDLGEGWADDPVAPPFPPVSRRGPAATAAVAACGVLLGVAAAGDAARPEPGWPSWSGGRHRRC